MLMLQPNPVKRINMKELREHDWFLGKSVANPSGIEVPRYLCVWDKTYRQKDHGVDEQIVDLLFKVT